MERETRLGLGCRLVGAEIPPLLGELLAAGDQWRIKNCVFKLCGSRI